MELAIIDHDELKDVHGGDGLRVRGEDVENLGKAFVNGGVNALNFFHEHPVTIAGKEFGVGGSRINKPFTNDPLSHLGKTNGHPVAAPHAKPKAGAHK